jgi:predicted DNA-binding antitoxin AbrB/MazE fold protein
MSQTVTAVYEKGVLRPLAALMLPESAQVEIHIERIWIQVAPTAEQQRVHEMLKAVGLVQGNIVALDAPEPLSEERQTELAKLLAVGKPLSEMILEEREDRW